MSVGFRVPAATETLRGFYFASTCSPLYQMLISVVSFKLVIRERAEDMGGISIIRFRRIFCHMFIVIMRQKSTKSSCLTAVRRLLEDVMEVVMLFVFVFLKKQAAYYMKT